MSGVSIEFYHRVGSYQAFEDGFIDQLQDNYRAFGEDVARNAAKSSTPDVILDQHKECYTAPKVGALLRLQHSFYIAYNDEIAQYGTPKKTVGSDIITPVIEGVPYLTSNIEILPKDPLVVPDLDQLRLNALITSVSSIPEEDLPLLFDTTFREFPTPQADITELIEICRDYGIEGIINEMYRPSEQAANALGNLANSFLEFKPLMQFYVSRARINYHSMIRVHEAIAHYVIRGKRRKLAGAAFDGMLNTLAFVQTAVMINADFSDEELQIFAKEAAQRKLEEEQKNKLDQNK